MPDRRRHDPYQDRGAVCPRQEKHKQSQSQARRLSTAKRTLGSPLPLLANLRKIVPRRGSGSARQAPGGILCRLLQPLFRTGESARHSVRPGCCRCTVHIAAAPKGERPLCCGRTFISAGLVDEARSEAHRFVDALLPFAEKGLPIVGLGPSCLLTLRDEIPKLLPGADTELLAKHARMLEGYIADQDDNPDFSLPLKSPAPRMLHHGHCHQKAIGAMSSIEKTLAPLPGTEVETVETSGQES